MHLAQSTPSRGDEHSALLAGSLAHAHLYLRTGCRRSALRAMLLLGRLTARDDLGGALAGTCARLREMLVQPPAGRIAARGGRS
jgi:hypothetical protein